jgi:hypothetical protein
MAILKLLPLKRFNITQDMSKTSNTLFALAKMFPESPYLGRD